MAVDTYQLRNLSEITFKFESTWRDFHVHNILSVWVGVDLCLCRKMLIQQKQCHERHHELRHEKTCLWSFRSGPTQTRLYSHRIWLEA